MNDKLKTHAKDYLVDFSENQSSWMKSLVFESLNTNGNVSKEKLDEIYFCLKEDKKVSSPTLNVSSASDTQNIVFKEFKHISGVNALAPNQTIKISDDVTILYGLNGAGKSSYFKVLNEMVGGNEQKEILPNIHKEQPESIQAKLIFSDRVDDEVTFDNSKRGFEPLTGCKVFDSSYLSGLLSQRTQTETILEPLGLHLFKYIANKIDEYKRRLKDDADNLKKSKPSIAYENFSDRLKGEFNGHDLSEQTIRFLKDSFIFSDEKRTQLGNKQNELNTLKQNNYADRITVLNTENSELQKITEFLEKKEELEKSLKGITQLLEQKREKEVANKRALEKMAILKELPLSGTSEWKAFISAGATLKEKHQIDNKTCIYCNQPLQDDALNLVQAYAKYLNDKSESELRTARNNLNDAKKQVRAISVILDVSDNFKKAYKDTPLEDTDITALDAAQKSVEGFKSYLLSIIDGKDAEKPEITFNPKLSGWASRKQSENKEAIKTLNADNTKKNRKIESLEKEIEKLSENKSISEQKTEIENWLEIDKGEKALRKKESKINTSKVTILSNTAHDNLLTSGLNTAFQDEVSQLGYQNLEVTLVKARGDKGTNTTKLTLKDADSIYSILSEGEQKAVGLALFIAEASIQKSQAPIILDDPVNSLDHRIAANFANRLLSLDNQLIIFNHNRLFQDAFETARNSHICKTLDSDCNKQGKHILVYDVNSEGKLRKGVLSFYKTNTSQSHIDNAKNGNYILDTHSFMPYS